MSNQEGITQCTTMSTLDKGKHQEDTRVDIAGSSRLASDQNPSLEHNAQGQLLDGVRARYLNIGVPLYQAALKGDWRAAEAIIDKQNDIVREHITGKSETALHIAVAAKHKRFVRNLLGRMKTDDLALQNKDGNTALCFAAASGVVEIAEMLVNMNRDLPMIRGGGGMTPLHMAAVFGHAEMVVYLRRETVFGNLTDEEYMNLFRLIIVADIYDEALRMLRTEKVLATSRTGTGETALHLMARKPYAISHLKHLKLFPRLANSNFKGMFRGAKNQTLAHQLVDELWKSFIQLPVENLWELMRSPSRLLFDAAESGNVEFLVILIRSYPDLIWKVDDNNRSIFHIAALNRHERVFNIIYELGAIKDLIAFYKDDTSQDNLLHLVARLPPTERLQIVSGAALQMQRELLWFEAVKKLIPRPYMKSKNKEGDIAHDLFLREHKPLRQEGEKWMKETATSCMLVATLIATVVFAAAFTVPGGNNEKSGYPNFRKKVLFDFFIISDSVALVSSITSIVIFLSILTSRYAEDDFRTVLPSKLMFGIFALFVSIGSMVLAFIATMFLIRYQESLSIIVVVILVASLTTLCFVWMHVELWVDTFRSAYLSKYLFYRRNSGIFI